MKRTLLPLNALRVFDAAARALSFTRAADELAVTPAAVGQQIRALEETLGVILFRRTPKGLELTPEGEAGLEQLRRGFLSFEDAVRAMRAGQSSSALAIAAPRALASGWLIEQLAAYRAANREVRIALTTCEEVPDFTQNNLDLAIAWAGDAGAMEGVPLGPPGLVTVGEGAPISWPGDRHADAAMSAPDAGAALAAARAGLGSARVPCLIAAASAGEGATGYWLLAPAPQWRQKKVRALVEALTATSVS